MRRIAIIASASGNGKTTVGRALAQRLGLPFVELDALVHGPGWVETPDAEVRSRLAPVLAGDGWVIDGNYHSKLGNSVLRRADTVVWLDLPIYVWFPRLLWRTFRRWYRREELWNGNRESLRAVLWGRDSLFAWAFRSHFRRRREWPKTLAEYPVIRLRSTAAVQQFLANAE
jgi:adenylate kinase family enzyme